MHKIKINENKLSSEFKFEFGVTNINVTRNIPLKL